MFKKLCGIRRGRDKHKRLDIREHKPGICSWGLGTTSLPSLRPGVSSLPGGCREDAVRRQAVAPQQEGPAEHFHVSS